MFAHRIAFLLAALAAATLAASPASASAPSMRALIVAVTEFEDPTLAPFALAGAAHDAQRMERAVGQLAAGEAPITVLQGREATLARTTAALAELGASARPGDRITLYFSAHGTRIPDSGEIDEADGLDEVLLLADAAEWDGTRIPGGLVDDALAAAVRVMRARGADVFLVIDSCASGGAARSGDDRRARSLPPALLGVPQRPLRSARREDSGWIEDDMPPGSGRLVVFAASPSSAAAWDTPEGGLFTTALAKALLAAPEDFVTLAQHQQRLQAAFPLPGPPSEMNGAIESGFFFTGTAPDLVQRAAALPRPDWSLDVVAAAQESCEAGGSAAAPRPLDPAERLSLAHCDAVMLAVGSAQPGRFDAWYVDSAGQRTLLSPVSGLYLDGRTPARLSFTFVTRDPATGQPYPPGTEHLLLLRRAPDGAHDAALTVAFGISDEG